MAQPKNQLKLSSFYGGDSIPRPYILLREGEAAKDRVDAPRVNEALMAWAASTPVEMGGALQKPTPPAELGAELPPARSALTIFMEERRSDVLAANPALVGTRDRADFVHTAKVVWREELSAEERNAFMERAEAEKKTHAAQASAAASNPVFKAFHEKMQKYKDAVRRIAGAVRAQAGAPFRQNKKAQKASEEEGEWQAADTSSDEDEEAVEEEVEEEEQAAEEEAPAPAASKGKGKKKAPKAAGGKAAAKADDGLDAMADLKLATKSAAKKGRAAPKEMYAGKFELPSSQASPSPPKTRRGAAQQPEQSPATRLRKQAAALPEASPAKKRRAAK